MPSSIAQIAEKGLGPRGIIRRTQCRVGKQGRDWKRKVLALALSIIKTVLRIKISQLKRDVIQCDLLVLAALTCLGGHL